MTIESEIYIIGKNSKLFKDFYSYSLDKHMDNIKTLVLCSYKDIDTIELSSDKKNICILFSISMFDTENFLILDKLLIKFSEVRVVGSSSAISYCAKSFNYSRVKYNQFMKAKTHYENGHNIYYYMFGDFYDSKRVGRKLKSNFSDLENFIFSSNLNDFSILCAVKTGKNSKFHKFIYELFEKIIGTKLTAALFKFLSPYTYGYTRIR
jgi:hypothetical protein